MYLPKELQLLVDQTLRSFGECSAVPRHIFHTVELVWVPKK